MLRSGRDGPESLPKTYFQLCWRTRAPQDRTYEADELRRALKRCLCPIYASGTLNRQFKRRNTERTSWDEAKVLVAGWDAAQSWDGPEKVAEPAPLVPDPASGEKRITLERAIRAYMAEVATYGSANTLKIYGNITRKLIAFAADRGYVMLDQFGPNDIREFRASWSVSPQTAAKNLSTVKTFFEFCLPNEWITRNPARLVKNPRGRDAADRRHEQKFPFSDEEIRRMYKECETSYGKQEVKWSREIHHHRVEGEYSRYNFKWTGQDLADFISVSLYTGLRISDVSTFYSDRMKPTGEVQIRTTKAGTHVYTWVPEWLQERIRTRAETFGPLIFGAHQTKDMSVVTDVWRRKLKKLWSLCGPWSAPPTPHRFRHTFARILLQRPGVTVRDVAELLGNSEQMVRKHYAAWIPERQERLTAVLRGAFEASPRLLAVA